MAIAEMNPEFWNHRFQHEHYMFSRQPNAFLVDFEGKTTVKGRALAVGDGEGRNGVWLAEQGWDVTSLDYSADGVAKTEKLAEERGVTVETVCADASTWDYPAEAFDLIVLLYFHLPRDAAQRAHAGCVEALKPGGHLLLEGFRKEQVGLLSGGPGVAEWMYSAEEINEDFGALNPLINRPVGRILREGRLHGSAAVYQFIGQKPA